MHEWHSGKEGGGWCQWVGCVGGLEADRQTNRCMYVRAVDKLVQSSSGAVSASLWRGQGGNKWCE